MIVYGKNVLSSLQDDPDSLQEVYVQRGFRDQKILQPIRKLNVPVHEVDKPYLDRICSKGIHQGIAAKVRDLKTWSVPQLLEKVKKDKPGLIVALDELQDPHNIGAILRTCDAIGADGIIMTKHNSASITPAAIKASTGAAYTVPVSIVANMSQALQTCKEAGYWIVGTDFEDSRDYREGIYDVPVVLVIGNEGKGISRNVKKQCDYKVNLPMKGSVQSLNASVAAGILLYEINRQREK